MADEITPKPGEGDILDPSKNNEEVARKLASQGEHKVPDAKDLVEASDALDQLAKEKVEEKEKSGSDEEAAKKKAEEEATAKKKLDEAGGNPEEVKRRAEAEAAAKTKRDSDTKKADEFFKDSPQLPSNASPKSSEAFSSVKIKAAQEISARDHKIDELTKKLTDAEGKLQSGDPAKEQELKELRTWRAKLDVEIDPKFKEFDKVIAQTHEFIYAQLKKSPVIKDDTIEEIKKLGGPENVNMTKIFDAIKDPALQRLIESKMSDVELAKFNREQAIKQAKDNVEKYLEDRQKIFEQSATAHNDNTKKVVDDLSSKLDWFKEKTVDDKADDATKAAIKSHNEFVAKQRENMQSALQDDSPEMRAIMITGMLQLMHTQRVHEITLAEMKKKDEVIVSKDAEIKALTEKNERLKSTSLSRFKEGGAPPGGGSLPKEKKDPDITVPATQALDDIAREISEKKARAAGIA